MTSYRAIRGQDREEKRCSTRHRYNVPDKVKAGAEGRHKTTDPDRNLRTKYDFDNVKESSVNLFFVEH